MTTIAQAPPTVKPHAIVGVKHFARQLAIAGKVAPKRGYKPILGFVRLIADPEQGATIEATDLEIGIRLRVLGGRCESRVAMLLPPAGASKLLKSACSEDVTLTDRGGSIAIGDGASVASVAYEGDPAEFPTMPDFPHDGPFWRVGADTLRGALARTMPFADPGSTRYALGGVFLDFDPAGACHMVATDGRRLSQVTIDAEPLNPPYHPIRAVLPIGACKMLDVIAKGEECVDVAYIPSDRPDMPHAGHFLFRVGHSGAELYSREIDGRFPHYQDIFSDHCDARAMVDVATLHRHAKSCAAVAESLSPDGSSRGFDLSIGASWVGLTIEGEGAPAFSATVPCEPSGPDRDATLDAHYFLGLLAPLAKSADPIEVRMIDHANPVEFRSGSMRAVIMPLTRNRPAPEPPPTEPPAPEPPDAGAIEDADRDAAADFGDSPPAPEPIPPAVATDLELDHAIDSALFTARVTDMSWAVVFTPGLNYPYALISLRTLEESPLRTAQRVRYVADPPRADDGPPPDDGGQGEPPSPPPADDDGCRYPEIGGRVYLSEPYPSPDGLRAWTLSRRESCYVVAENPTGRASCECPDFTYRAEEFPGHRCKHITALIGFGMLAEWFPAPPPDPEPDPMPTEPAPPPPARDSRITRRKVEAMPYGSIEQVEAADLHFSRLMAWDAKREDRWYADKAIRKLLMSDVWYLANRRWLDRRDAETVMEPDWNPTPPAPPAGATELSPPENVAAKLERIHNRTTKYEVTATRDGRTVLLGYTRKGRRGMDSLICSDDGRRDAIVKVLGTNRITYDKKASQGAVMGEWTIKFSGRTHRDCIIEGEWPFVMTIAESMGA